MITKMIIKMIIKRIKKIYKLTEFRAKWNLGYY